MLAATRTSSAAKDRSNDDLLNYRPIKHVVVLGANGAMGLGSGALFTTAVPRVTFLARTKEKADAGLAAAIKMVRSSTVANRVETGSYDDDFERAVGEADLIFEAVTERLDLKRQFFARIDSARRPDSIVATVTSGLSINQLAAEQSDSFRKNFLGLHFFNPPNVIVGTELIAGKDTDPKLVDFIEAYCTKKLGRAMVRTADTPGFAGNRVGFKLLNECAILAEEHGPLLIDEVVGPYTGRALTPLATVDLVGWDIHRAIVDNIHNLAPDEAHDTLKLPDYMAKLMDQGVLGRKTGKGFFGKNDAGERIVLDPKSGSWVPKKSVSRPDLPFIKEISTLHRLGRYQDAMKAFAQATGKYAQLAQKVIGGYISYAFHRVGEVTEDISAIDGIMGYGFNWAPPSVLVDLMGIKDTIAMLERAKLPVPPLLANAKEGTTFFNDPLVNRGKFFVAA
ncbi:MAG: 3-hydroxyacyl-CoA dehydrogenase family protein [Deltaproteobacteria bacterium]|nr:3-hydroxyacyl-CoA dehydrogenase family protein [Deltaproteobacteria bacterium]